MHVRISSPPTCYPCYFGIDTPTRAELIAASQGVEDICSFLTADSLGYISHQGLQKATDYGPYVYCDACFTGNYPMGGEPTEGVQLGLF